MVQILSWKIDGFLLEISSKMRLKRRKTVKSALLTIASWIGFAPLTRGRSYSVLGALGS